MEERPLAEAIAAVLIDGFDKHYRLFRETSAAAKDRIERAAWAEAQRAVQERIRFYDARVLENVERLRAELDLESLDAADSSFPALVSRLREQLHHHATDEEDEQFPRLRTYVPREKLIEMREQVEKAKKLAPTRPHPNSPNSEVFHKLVGPGVGLMDRVRDKLTGRTTA